MVAHALKKAAHSRHDTVGGSACSVQHGADAGVVSFACPSVACSFWAGDVLPRVLWFNVWQNTCVVAVPNDRAHAWYDTVSVMSGADKCAYGQRRRPAWLERAPYHVLMVGIQLLEPCRSTHPCN